LSKYLELLEDDDASESSSLPEDDHADLLTENVSRNFIATLAKIAVKDPEIYKKDKQFWKGNQLYRTGE
jgi:hypothetical protein